MIKLEDWIDLMEGDAAKLEKLELLLKHSPGDKDILENLERLRRLIAINDPAKKIEAAIANPNFMKTMHKKIMKAICEQQEANQIEQQQDSRLVAGEDLHLSQGSCKN